MSLCILIFLIFKVPSSHLWNHLFLTTKSLHSPSPSAHMPFLLGFPPDLGPPRGAHMQPVVPYSVLLTHFSRAVSPALVVLAVAPGQLTPLEAARRSRRLERTGRASARGDRTWGRVSADRRSGCRAADAKLVHCRQAGALIRPPHRASASLSL